MLRRQYNVRVHSVILVFSNTTCTLDTSRVYWTRHVYIGHVTCTLDTSRVHWTRHVYIGHTTCTLDTSRVHCVGHVSPFAIFNGEWTGHGDVSGSYRWWERRTRDQFGREQDADVLSSFILWVLALGVHGGLEWLLTMLKCSAQKRWSIFVVYPSIKFFVLINCSVGHRPQVSW